MHQDTQLMFRNNSSSIHNLEVQVGQLANSLSLRNQGALPSNAEKNPKEQLKAINLRSGIELQPSKKNTPTPTEEEEKDKEKEKEQVEVQVEEEANEQTINKKKEATCTPFHL